VPAGRGAPWAWVFLAVGVVMSLGFDAVEKVEKVHEAREARFSGARALADLAEFVRAFPNRHSGQPNNRLASTWLHQRFSEIGLQCDYNEGEVINYSRRLEMRNVVCRLQGERSEEILVAAHLDQSPETIEGADDDGSGIAIMLQLAAIFASEAKPRYSLVFVATDAEEYGQLGIQRYLQTHPESGRILVGISLDNLSKEIYDGLRMSPVGFARNYGPLWLQLLMQEAAQKAGNTWVPRIPSAWDQILNQAVPISRMDQGHMVAAGIAAFGLAGHVPAGSVDADWATYHTAADTVEMQSERPLHEAGRATEVLIRELLARPQLPVESGPYVYLSASGHVLRGPGLWLIFLLVPILFLGCAWRRYSRLDPKSSFAWKGCLLHFMSFWLPNMASVGVLYVCVAVGLLDEYALYPATPRDPLLTEVRWLAVGLFVMSSVGFFVAAQAIRKWLFSRYERPSSEQMSIVALAVLAVVAGCVIAVNPFSLLLLLPTICWIALKPRPGQRNWINLLLFVAGGAVVYALFYVFGTQLLRIDFYILWYLLMMLSIKMIGPVTVLLVAATVAAGLVLLLPPKA